MNERMNSSITHGQVSVFGSSHSVTSMPSAVGNEPVGQWMPGIYDRLTITEAGQEQSSEDNHWADLAASARADWAAETPF